MAEPSFDLPQIADRQFHAAEARLTAAVSPIALWLAFADWEAHLANDPFRRWTLAQSVASDLADFARAAIGEQPVQGTPTDRRFIDPGWRTPPFNLIHQSFLLWDRWWRRATTGVEGVRPDSERIVAFTIRQWLDAFAPSNSFWLNPKVLRATAETGGANLVQGLENFAQDIGAMAAGKPVGQGDLQVGRDLAATPGEVVFRNSLIELIQYRPTTDKVRPEPILFVPAWIMKYYILDLSPRNSLIRYFVDAGYTVYCISWRNPDAEMRDFGFDEYFDEGLFAALDVVSRAHPRTKVHACGYCLGGTLLAAGAAAMARDGDDRLASLTLFAAQTDFTDAGELQLFTTESQVAFLDDLMWRQGYLDGAQMSAAFQLLRSNDLIWSRMLGSYLLGRRDLPDDLMTWNADTTRLPYRMHSQYLHQMFLRDDLAEGRFTVHGEPVALEDIKAPIFMVGTETDHVSPWRSVYKLHLLNPGEITFVLTSGGHNAGIVSEPGHPGRRYRWATRKKGAPFRSPDEWLDEAPLAQGSWWPTWRAWLDRYSSEATASARLRKSRLGSAPGSYVHQA